MPKALQITRFPIPLAVAAIAVFSLLPTTSRCQQSGATDAKSAPTAKAAAPVTIPVTVRDKKGALVPNVAASDLTLTEDGHPEAIQSFSRPATQTFRLGLLVDTSRPVMGAIESERVAAEKFVDQMLPAEPSQSKPDEAFLIHFDREVELLQDFTPSLEKLHRELDQMGSTKQSSRQDQGPETVGEDRDRAHGQGTALYDAIYLAADELMKGKDGHKALIVFSDGVDRGSKETMNDAIDAADKAGLVIYTVYFRGEQERESNFGFPGSGRRTGGGYPGGGGGYPGGGGGYPGGGGGQPRQPERKLPGIDGRKTMETIATRTGGHAYEAKKRDDLGPIYNLIAEELRGQYLLTFVPDVVDKEGGFHKIAVKANKGDLTVIAPEGYYAPGPDDAK